MKKLIIFLFLIFSTSVFASAPYRLSGYYAFGGLVLSQARNVEVVPYQNQARYKQLLFENYTCELITTFYRCKKVIQSSIPLNLMRKLERQYDQSLFQFIPSGKEATQTNDADELKEWDVYDRVSFNNEHIDKYNYFLIGNELHKAKLPFSTEQWLLVESDASFALHSFESIPESRWKWKEYVILVKFVQH